MKELNNLKYMECEKFILNYENVYKLSWSTRRPKCDGEFIKIPCFLRKSSLIMLLWRKYVMISCLQSRERNIWRTVCIEVSSALTKKESGQKASIVFILCALVYDNLQIARNIINTDVSDSVERRKVLSYVSGVTEFLKYHFVAHLKRTADDPTHDVIFGTLTDQSGESWTVVINVVQCSK